MAEKSDFDSELLLSYRFPETTFTYTDRDAVVYALGVGACGRDAVDPDELKYLYHENGQKHIQVLPTFAALFSHESVPDGLDLPGFKFDRRLLLHGSQYIELYKPLPSSGCENGLIFFYKQAYQPRLEPETSGGANTLSQLL